MFVPRKRSRLRRLRDKLLSWPSFAGALQATTVVTTSASEALYAAGWISNSDRAVLSALPSITFNACAGLLRGAESVLEDEKAEERELTEMRERAALQEELQSLRREVSRGSTATLQAIARLETRIDEVLDGPNLSDEQRGQLEAARRDAETVNQSARSAREAAKNRGPTAQAQPLEEQLDNGEEDELGTAESN